MSAAEIVSEESGRSAAEHAGSAGEHSSSVTDSASRPGLKLRGLFSWTAASWSGPVLVWLLASLYLYSDFVRHPSRGVPGGADGILYAWFLQAIEHSLMHGHTPFLTSAMNAPDGVNSMWNTSLILLAVPLAPLVAWVGALAVVGWLMVLAPVLCTTSAYVVLRWITGRAAGCALAATLYGFGPFFAGQAGHLHLTFTALFLPWILWFGYRLFVRPAASSVRVGLGLGLTVAAAMLVSEEVVVIAVIAAATGVVIGLACYPRMFSAHRRFAFRGLVVSGVSALVLLAIPLGYQFFGPQAIHGSVTPGDYPQDLAGLVRPGALQYYSSAGSIAANNRFYLKGVESTGYLGWPLIVLCLTIVAWLTWRRDPFGIWWLLTTALVLSFSFGSRIEIDGSTTFVRTPWALLRKLPLLEGVVVARFSMVVTLLVAVLVAYGLARLPRGRANVLGLAVVALCLVPLRPAHGHSYSQISVIDPPALFTSAAINAIEPGSTVLVLPMIDNPDVAKYAMYYQIKAKMRFNIVGGNGVFSRNGVSTGQPNLPKIVGSLYYLTVIGSPLPPSLVTSARSDLTSSGIRYIVITDQERNHDAVVAAAQLITGCQPRAVGGVILCALKP